MSQWCFPVFTIYSFNFTYVIHKHKGQLLLLRTIPKKTKKTLPYIEL